MKVETKALCPNCQGKDKWIESRILEKEDAFEICGMCKGKGWVFFKDESYSTVKTHCFSGRRKGFDVVRLIGIPQEKPDIDFNKFCQRNDKRFIGFTKVFKTIIQNDINFINY